MARPTTDRPWTSGALKSHLGAAFGRLHGLRAEMLEAVAPGGDPARLPAVLEGIAEHVSAEVDWLEDLQPVPEGLRRSDRARYLADYAQQLVATAQALTIAATPPLDPTRLGAFGVSLLQLLAREQGAKELRR